jgi:hypothetical protein
MRTAPREHVDAVGVHLRNDRLMRGEIDLRDRDGDILPLNRSLLFRIVDLEIVDRDIRGLDVNIESAAREVRDNVGVHGQLAARNVADEGRLRKSL